MEMENKDRKNRNVRNTSLRTTLKPNGLSSVPIRVKALLITLAAVVLLIGTWAVMHVITEAAINTFTLGKSTVKIEEDFHEAPEGWAVKKVSLINENLPGNVPGVVRAMVVPVLKDSTTGEGLSASLQPLSKPIDGKMVMGDFTFVFDADWEANWFYKDGYFYYTKVLEPGEESAQLLERVLLTTDTVDKRMEYANVSIEVEVMADILQADGGAPADAWGITVSGNEVSP